MITRLPRIGIDQLQKGDVLLSRGRGPVAFSIRFLYGTSYTHAALWTGDVVIESEPFFVKARPLHESINERERAFVDVYRWRPDAVDRPDLDPVVEAALAYRDAPYAISDMMVLFFVAVKAKSYWSPNRSAFRAQLPEFAAAVRAYEALGGKVGITCAELVIRAFQEADRANGRFALRLDHLPSEYVGLAASEVPSPAFHLLTAEDLHKSPSLVPIGRLDLPKHIRSYENPKLSLSQLTREIAKRNAAFKARTQDKLQG